MAWRRYQQWIQRHTATADDLFRQRMAVSRLRERPLISVVVPVHETPPEILRQMLTSIARQTYPHWQLCLVDDGSSESWIARHLERLARRDARVRFRRRPTNGGISAATNDAIALATGDLVAFVDHDDLFDPRMLYEVVRRFLDKPDTDIVHFDLDHFRSGGQRVAPVFTPIWSPELLLSVTYIVHPVVRRALLERVGPLRPEYDGAQDYDLILRLAEATDRIERIPEVFYHWRVWPRSASDGGKPYARAARKRVLDAAIARRGLRATCEDRPQADWFRVRFAIDGDPLVSVIVPLASQGGDAPGRASDRLIASLRRYSATTAYRHFELVLVGPPGVVDSLSDANQLDGEGIPVRTVRCESADEGVAVSHGALESRGAYLLVPVARPGAARDGLAVVVTRICPAVAHRRGWRPGLPSQRQRLARRHRPASRAADPGATGFSVESWRPPGDPRRQPVRGERRLPVDAAAGVRRGRRLSSDRYRRVQRC